MYSRAHRVEKINNSKVSRLMWPLFVLCYKNHTIQCHFTTRYWLTNEVLLSWTHLQYLHPVAKIKVTAASKDISYFSSSHLSITQRAVQTEVAWLRGRESKVTNSANQRERQQAVADALSGWGGETLFQRLCTDCFFPSSLSPFSGPLWSQKGWGGWAFGEAGETIPEMSCYSQQSSCFV